MADQQQPQQQATEPIYNRNEEYRDAQRAAVEAITTGRETLETVVRQGEQLQNAETMAEETEYKLDKADRILKGMTWAGWFSNKFSKDVEPPVYTQGSGDGTDAARSILGPPKVYDNVPESCTAAAQAVQNYHANLQVLEDCETNEQIATCKLICDNMHDMAVKRAVSLTIDNRSSTTSTTRFAERLKSDIETLRQRQLALQQMRRGLSVAGVTVDDTRSTKTTLMKNAKKIKNDKPETEKLPLDSVQKQQEDHLDTMAKHLDELGSLAGNLNTTLSSHGETLDSLDEKNESMLFKTKMVTRRADRLIQKKSWVKEKAEFVMYAWIKEQISGQYLSVAPNNDSTLVLSNILNERCIFGLWKRKQVMGLQNQYNMKWAGQSLLGQLTCSANTFGRREEWDMDEDWSSTTLIVASAGWGHG
ncbi:MAG: hypothetical protein SGARI_001844, partial [Bacillariaceae sp.]